MAKCKVVTVCKRRRRICWGANGKIRTNTSVSGGSKGRHKGRSGTKCRTAKGRIKKGCHMTKSGRLVRG